MNTAALLGAVSLTNPRNRFYLRTGKRFCDIFGATLATVLSLPVIAAGAAFIALVSPGEILFRQQRKGRNGKTFVLYKLRTLQPGDNAWPVLPNDPRLIFGGKFLRGTKLDELPQLWNVLRGDMSLVGPRPYPILVAEEFQALFEMYQDRLSVQPGMTGFSQLYHEYPDNAAELKKRLRMDKLYLCKMCFSADLAVMLKTAALCLRGCRFRN